MSDKSKKMRSKKREFYYKGKTKDELKELNDDEAFKLLNSRARRSLKRGLTHSQKVLMERVEEANEVIKQGKEQPEIKTHCRNMIILPKMIDLTIKVHNGISFEKVVIKPEMIGHYLGEFALTRKRVEHSKGGSGVKEGKGKGTARVISLK